MAVFDEFYVNNALTVALFKQFQLNNAMTIQTGWLGSLALDAQPSSARRHEYDFWLGWRWRILTPLESNLLHPLAVSLPSRFPAGCDPQCRSRFESLLYALGPSDSQ